MNVRGAFPVDTGRADIAARLREALIDSSLPGEADGLSREDFDRIAAFVLNTAQHRSPGEPAFEILSSGRTTDGPPDAARRHQ
jgi:hypothetical protein